MIKQGTNIFLLMAMLAVIVAGIRTKHAQDVLDLTAWSKDRDIKITSVDEVFNLDEEGPWTYDAPGGSVFRLHCEKDGKPITVWARKLWNWSFYRETGPDSYVAEK